MLTQFRHQNIDMKVKFIFIVELKVNKQNTTR